MTKINTKIFRSWTLKSNSQKFSRYDIAYQRQEKKSNFGQSDDAIQLGIIIVKRIIYITLTNNKSIFHLYHKQHLHGKIDFI